MYNSYESIRKSSHSCNQQLLNETFNFIRQEQGLIPQYRLLKVTDQFCNRLFYMLAEPLSATVQAGIVALCCQHTQHRIYVGCKKPISLMEIIFY